MSLTAACAGSVRLSSRLCVLIPARSNSNRSSLACCGRPRFERLYRALLVRPDGSTVHVRHPEPRRILTIPVDPASLSDEERRARQKKKRDGTRARAEAEASRGGYDDDDDFRADAYQNMWRKK
ncbi:large ribosomal subunit protein mL55 [Salarias fasciatus]|uniref:large ribosomal subunit protein mL55 n=1 Tax=Salarias fasciatus TaxID=181472 RepID=UPI001176AF87|nr:39S ribosomal protein L55, mitochondrial [Salarias fasciatus]